MLNSTQTGLVIWLLGLSGAGKSTVAALLENELNANGFRTLSLDGDKVRAGLNRDWALQMLTGTKA